MRIEEIVYKDYLEFTKQSEMPQWAINIMNQNLDWIFNKKLTDKVQVAGKQLPVGLALIFNIVKEVGITPSELKQYLPLTKKNLAKLLSLIYKKSNDGIKNIWIQWMLQLTGFYAGTRYAASYRATDFKVPDDIVAKKNKLVEQLENGEIDAVTFDNEIKKLAKELIKRYDKQKINLADIIHSGSAKHEIQNIQRMLIARGLSINSKGEINKVITTSLAEGHKPDEYVAGASEAIVSQYHKSRSTAKPGYLVRSLNELLSMIHISEKEDCESKKYLTIKVDSQTIAEALKNRYDYKGKLITESPKVGSTVKLRSPLYCQAEDGICRKCLGEIFFKKGYKPGDPLLIVSTSIADALTGSALKAAHAGIKLNLEKIDFRKEI